MPVGDSQHSECCNCLRVEAIGKTTRSNKDNWISCDCCSKWFHASCGGFGQSDYTKISRDNLWLKCVVCCVQQLLLSETVEDSSSLIESVISVAKNRNTECYSRKGTGKPNKSKKKSKVGKVADCDDTLQSDQVRCCTNTVSQLTDISENQERLNCTISECNPPSAIGSKIAEKCDINVFDDCVDSVVISQYSDVDRILVIDNIDNPVDFSSSQRILKEIDQYCTGLKIDFAYSLAKGGVAIHTQSKEDRNYLIDALPAESFGGGIKHSPIGRGQQTAYIKNIDTSVNVRKITVIFSEKGIELSYIRRLTKRYTGKPVQVVKVKCAEEVFGKLMSTKLVINNKTCVIEKERSVKVIRCFHCQRFGHIARNCKNCVKCEFCAESHQIYETCLRDVCCANCSGHHPASSSQCPVYLQRYENITAQHSEYLHFSSTVETCSTEARH